MLIKIANYSANIVVVVLGYNIPRYAVDIVILESTTSCCYAYYSQSPHFNFFFSGGGCS